jgi:Asp-tRNA(Asn)/Glu-tRNA(Gln) amidotransferase A subunit family amidase
MNGPADQPFPLTVEEAVRRIRARNPVLRTFVSTRLGEAVAEAGQRRAEAPRSAIHGVPYSLKDSWDVAGAVTTGGSYRYKDRVPAASSPVHEVFEAAGAVMVGKTALSDLAMSPEGSSWVGGIARNPHDPSRTTGGSSGGAAAAVADGMSSFDWGTDIGGSIRLPAAHCGVMGLRLSSATWPLAGDFPSPPASLKAMNGQGPVARTVPQIRAVVGVAAPRLRTGQARPFALRGAYVYGPRPSQGLWPSFVADVEPLLREAVGEVRHDHGLLSLSAVQAVYGALWASHFDDLLRVDPTMGLAEGLGAAISAIVLRGRFGDRRLYPTTAEVFALIALGRFTIFRDRARAVRDAERYRASVVRLWDQGFVVVAPVSVYPAPRHHRSMLNPRVLFCTVPANLADATALAVPCGRFPDGMPRALQVMGPPGSEEAILDIGERIVAAASQPAARGGAASERSR